ncbi:hypothetical protein CRUP_017137 [Coryphaenoides rupestris]|nr:hypothetical protein CRUP_017137 [Coryphaenoides rupestris]
MVLLWCTSTRDNTNIPSSYHTMHCFTTAPLRKLVFQKGTAPSSTKIEKIVPLDSVQDVLGIGVHQVPPCLPQWVDDVLEDVTVLLVQQLEAHGQVMVLQHRLIVMCSTYRANASSCWVFTPKRGRAEVGSLQPWVDVVEVEVVVVVVEWWRWSGGCGGRCGGEVEVVEVEVVVVEVVEVVVEPMSQGLEQVSQNRSTKGVLLSAAAASPPSTPSGAEPGSGPAPAPPAAGRTRRRGE